MSCLIGVRTKSVQMYASVRVPARMTAAPDLMEVNGLRMKFQVLSRRRRATNKPLLIALHDRPVRAGHGGNENSLLEYAEKLGEPFGAQVVCIRAPYDVHRDGYCWFRVNSFVPEPNHIVEKDLPGIIDEVISLGHTLPEIYNTDSTKTVLMGFSQGASVSWATATHFTSATNGKSNPFAGHVCLSGVLRNEIIPTNMLDKECRQKAAKIYVYHGARDSITPIKLAHRNIERAQGIGLDIREWVEDPKLDHELPFQGTEAYTRLGRFLESLFHSS